MEYGRPLTADRPPRPPNGPIPSDLTPSQISLLAQSELIQPMRRLIRWMTRTGPTPEQSIHDLLNRINDELDEWFFKWTSPASECSATLASSGTFSSVLAHHVRLCLNMLPIQMWDSGLNEATLSVLNKSQRLAIVSAMAIIDHFHHDFTTPISTTNLRFAPGIAGSILAHAVLCLLPKPIAVNRSARLTATLASGTTNSIVERYFEKGLGFLRGNRSNQGHFTPTFARTIEGLLGLDVITQESRGQEVSEAQQALLHQSVKLYGPVHESELNVPVVTTTSSGGRAKIPPGRLLLIEIPRWDLWAGSSRTRIITQNTSFSWTACDAVGAEPINHLRRRSLDYSISSPGDRVMNLDITANSIVYAYID